MTTDALSPSALADCVERQAPSELTATELLEQARAVVGPSLRDAIATLPRPVADVACYHFGWATTDGRTYLGKDGNWGKGFRSALVLACADAVGSDRAAAVSAAVAVELVHNASLIHDDIIDGDSQRRSRPAVWSAFGIPAAILAGDALFFLANQTLGRADAPLNTVGVGWLNQAGQHLVAGEHADAALAGQATVTLEDALAVASGKTGALLAAACALGALAGAADPAVIERFHTMGHHLGLAYQLADDLLGIWGTTARTGKPERSDLRSRKKSLPVVAALAADCPASHELAALYQRPTPLDEQDLHTAAALIEEAGGHDWALRQATHHFTTALTSLHSDSCDPAMLAKLTNLAQYITRRDH
ncbi:polyprenyl synthetase family protein [Nocardia sp. NPDC023852]|uniref:polyprenyl synthetase family protein n=1 Tax=Nocardia sp. NPDC023852 TaxID=3154697 RepID=UPI00340EAF39